MTAEKRQSTTPTLDTAWKAAKKRANQALDERDALGMVQAETEANVIWMKRELVNDLARLAHRLAWLAETLESDPDYAPNACGEIQGSGLSIDIQCAEIAKLRGLLGDMATARRATAEKGGTSCTTS